MCFCAPLAPLLLYFPYSVCGIFVFVLCAVSSGTAPAGVPHLSAMQKESIAALKPVASRNVSRMSG